MIRSSLKNFFALGGMLFIIFGLSACTVGSIETGPTQTDHETVEVGSADTAVVHVAMGIGKLVITGGADDLLEAEFIYNVPDWKPDIAYSVEDGNGRLQIQQPDSQVDGFPDSDVENNWNLMFNNDLPLEMDIDLGVGESTLDLRSLNLTSLNLESGAGSTTVLADGSPLRSAEINAGLGEIKLDLSEGWEADATVSIDAGVGELTVVLPSDVGVIVDAELGIGDLHANGFTIQDDKYVNGAYGESEVTLTVDLHGGVGEVTLQLEE